MISTFSKRFLRSHNFLFFHTQFIHVCFNHFCIHVKHIESLHRIFLSQRVDTNHHAVGKKIIRLQKDSLTTKPKSINKCPCVCVCVRVCVLVFCFCIFLLLYKQIHTNTNIHETYLRTQKL